jgi:hypothetical protein
MLEKFGKSEKNQSTLILSNYIGNIFVKLMVAGQNRARVNQRTRFPLSATTFRHLLSTPMLHSCGTSRGGGAGKAESQ